MAMLSTSMVMASQPTAADATKTITATCFSEDPETQALLNSFGELTAPVTVNTTAPAFVEPGQTGVDVAVQWSLSLAPNVVDIIAAITPSLTISDARIVTKVEGPTSTTEIPGAPPAQTINLTPGQAFNSAFPPFTGQLNDIGSSGIIKLTTDRIEFKISLPSGPISEIDLVCNTGATVASIPIKVAGSPDIVQPIEVKGTPGQPVSVDVLNEFVTNGFTKDGVEQQVDPSTLRIVEGDATVQNGQIVANAPAAGSSSEVTFEVCAGTIVLAEAEPGVTEVQTLRIYEDPARIFSGLPPGFEYRRALGTQFSFAGESGDTLWTASPKIPGSGNWTPTPDLSGYEGEEGMSPEEIQARINSWWANNVNNFWLQSVFRAPSAAEVKAALESIPSIGAGNVEVEKLPAENAGKEDQKTLRYHPYRVTFAGDLANKSVDNIGAAKTFSFIPQIDIASLLPSGGDGDGEGGEDEKTPIPGAEGVPDLQPGDPFYDEYFPIGGDPKKYLDYIDRLIQRALNSGDYAGWWELVQLQLAVTFDNIVDLIDVAAATALLGQIVIPPADAAVEVQGEDPTPVQTQELCSQGIITVSSDADVGGSTEGPGAGAGVEGTTDSRNGGGAAVSVAG